jgi:hypothetical protein
LILLLLLLFLLFFLFLKDFGECPQFLVVRESLQSRHHLDDCIRLFAKDIKLCAAMEVIFRGLCAKHQWRERQTKDEQNL